MPSNLGVGTKTRVLCSFFMNLSCILGMVYAFWPDSPHNKLKISLTVLGWNAANSDLVSLTYVSKLQLDISISFAKSGPIFEKYSLKSIQRILKLFWGLLH